jgi:UDP-GlcNAc3NAcA epimerase
MKVVTIVGARPQLIKAAAVSRVLRREHTEFLIHTGQHYDAEMSDVFFTELRMAAPDVNLAVGSGTHGAQTAAMLSGIEGVLIGELPDWVLVYGDTNSTLAGALAAAKLRLPVAHVEAGLRSFNRAMPEGINRVMVDHLADLLLCPSATAVDNLGREGIRHGVHLVGDVMLDALLHARDQAQRASRVLTRLGLTDRTYVVATVHRAENSDHLERLSGILQGLEQSRETVVFPVHPRTRRKLEGLQTSLSRVMCIEPLGYLDMVRLVAGARMVVTDSGGLQKEAYWLGVPCVTVREETEWVETVAAGWNKVVGADVERIATAIREFGPPTTRPELYGEPGAACRCVDRLMRAGGST